MRLSSTESADMVAKVTGGRTLPPEVLDQIVAKTDGVPLFVEELTTSVIESDLVREQDGRYVLIGQLPAHGAASVLDSLSDTVIVAIDCNSGTCGRSMVATSPLHASQPLLRLLRIAAGRRCRQ